MARLSWPVTAEGLQPVYEEAVPGAAAVIDIRLPDAAPEVVLAVTLRDARAEEVASLLTTFRRLPKGLELEKSLVWVQPRHRGRGVSDSVTLAEIGVLRGLSGHPDTRLRLRADGAASPDGARERIGPYSWARFGLLEFDSPEDLEELRAAWRRWAPPERHAAADSWRRPADVAADGKDFLLSPETVLWRGHLYVNRPLPPEAAQALARLPRQARGEGPTPRLDDLRDRLPRLFGNAGRPEGTRLRALSDWHLLGGRPESGALESLWSDPSDAVLRTAFRVARDSGSRGLAARAARRLLSRPCPGDDGRPARLEALRVLAETAGRPEELAELRGRLADPALRQATDDWIQALETGRRSGAASPH